VKSYLRKRTPFIYWSSYQVLSQDETNEKCRQLSHLAQGSIFLEETEHGRSKFDGKHNWE
jgi:hypothetical protein